MANFSLSLVTGPEDFVKVNSVHVLLCFTGSEFAVHSLQTKTVSLQNCFQYFQSPLDNRVLFSSKYLNVLVVFGKSNKLILLSLCLYIF